MARSPNVVTNTKISSVAHNALLADYVSQTDPNAQSITSALTVTGSLTLGDDANIQNNTVQRTITATTLGAGVTTFAVVGEAMTITGDALANTIATITGGVTGQILILTFVDALVTITDDNTHAANTIDLSGAFVSADDTTLVLFFDGTSWYELSRSVN